MTTRLTKTGQPVQGTSIEIWVDNILDGNGKVIEYINAWESARVVGKGWGKGGNSDLVIIFVEWDDGQRQRFAWKDLNWRAIP